MMAELLSLLYEHYLPFHRHLKCLQKDRKRYRKIPGLKNNYHIPEISKIVKPFDAKIRRFITNVTWPRLFVIRLKNALTDFMPLVRQWKNCCNAVNCLNEMTHPIIALSGWLIHGLRLMTTLVNLVKHTIPGPWMSKHEQRIGWQLRLKTRVSLHWFQIVDDTLWIISTLAPASIFLTSMIALFEVVFAALQSMIEINRLQKVLGEHTQAGKQKTTAHETRPESEVYEQYLQLSITHEQKKLMLRIITIISVSALVVLKSLLPVLLPALAFNPIVPFVISAMLVVITLACHVLGKWLEHQKPSEKLTSKYSKNTSAFTTGFTFFDSNYRSGSASKCNTQSAKQMALMRLLPVWAEYAENPINKS